MSPGTSSTNVGIFDCKWLDYQRANLEVWFDLLQWKELMQVDHDRSKKTNYMESFHGIGRLMCTCTCLHFFNLIRMGLSEIVESQNVMVYNLFPPENGHSVGNFPPCPINVRPYAYHSWQCCRLFPAPLVPFQSHPKRPRRAPRSHESPR